MNIRTFPAAAAAMLLALTSGSAMSQENLRPRARDLGIQVGVFSTGTHNAITDVPGVRVGQVTVWEGEDIRTGVTAILQHPGNVFREKVPGAVVVGNGFGKLVGVTQIRELGEMETPILLTCTLCVWKAADFMVEWLLEQEDMEGVGSINPVVGETNDGGLNDIRSRPIRREHVRQALETAAGGPVEEGAVGAGTGTRAFGWKGGIGSSSRVLPEALGGYTVGVLVQSNYGGILTMAGAPLGQALGQYAFQRYVEESGALPDGDSQGDGSPASPPLPPQDSAPVDNGSGIPDARGGSIMMVVATDAPLSARNLERLARRALMGLARTGSSGSNGSGDYVLAFSSAPQVRRRGDDHGPRQILDLPNPRMPGLFQAAIEATEEAIYNSLLRAVTVTGFRGRTAEALPLEETVDILKKHGVVKN